MEILEFSSSCDLLSKKLNFLFSIRLQLLITCLALTGLVGGSFLPTANWLGEDPLVNGGVFAGVRLPCGRNVEKKFLEGVVAVLTARWLVTKSLRGWRERKSKK